MQHYLPAGNTGAAWLALLVPDILHSPRNSFSVCLKLNLTDATKSYKNFDVTVLRDYTHSPPSTWWQNVFSSPSTWWQISWQCSQAIAARWSIEHSAQPSTSLPKLRDGSASFPTAAEQCCSPAWSARTSFVEVHLHTLALRKGRAGITNVLWFA